METFIAFYREAALYLGIAIIAAGLGFIFYLLIKLASTKDKKKKYDFISEHERDFLWYASLLILIGAGFCVSSRITTDSLTLFVSLFVCIMFGTIVGVILYNYLKFYYPTYIERRLNKLRYSPRVNPKTGNKMKLLTEEEEDVHLDEGMQAEEDIFSVDYDVWIDEETGDKKIEKYKGSSQALKSPACGYYTLRVVKEEVLESPTEDREGTLVKHYECSYTGYKTQKVFKIAKLKKSLTDTISPKMSS